VEKTINIYLQDQAALQFQQETRLNANMQTSFQSTISSPPLSVREQKPSQAQDEILPRLRTVQKSKLPESLASASATKRVKFYQ
jgi:hypothetical protein